MVIATQQPQRNPEAPSSNGKAREAVKKNGTSMAPPKILFVFNKICTIYREKK
jgi:hypothetical protein